MGRKRRSKSDSKAIEEGVTYLQEQSEKSSQSAAEVHRDECEKSDEDQAELQREEEELFEGGARAAWR
jgi:hypothetical protein